MFAAHFVDSVLKHDDSFAKAPEKIVINFNFTLSEVSAITVAKDGAPVNIGETVLGGKMLSMSATLPNNAGDGMYVVKYKACWPDKSCHDSQFAFKVDSKMGELYLDLTGKSRVAIHLKDFRFTPNQIVISRRTNIPWIIVDPVDHFVNSDPHPSHNALAALDSLALKQGESYSFTFAQPGEWAYHCGASKKYYFSNQRRV